jgi:hypothetical protein
MRNAEESEEFQMPVIDKRVTINQKPRVVQKSVKPETLVDKLMPQRKIYMHVDKCAVRYEKER